MNTRAAHRLISVLVVVMLVLILLIVALLALPAVIRALPGRYAYYLPEPLQDLRQVAHAETLATPDLPPAATVELPKLPTATPTLLLPTSTPLPTHVPTPLPTATPTPVPTLPASCFIDGVVAERQGWNNCGPTTLGMLLSHWGRSEQQAQIAPVLKPDPEDKNVGPYEMAEYARGLGLEAKVVPGGDVELLKRLVVADFPVIVETWYVDHDDHEQMGHYRLVVGYDDVQGHFITHDSLHTPMVNIGYRELDELWRAFNRLYLVAYTPERTADLELILGPSMDETHAFRRALDVAYDEALNPPVDCVAYLECDDAEAFAWFNVGTNLTALGDYGGAAAAYDQARALGVHYRMLWYQFGPYRAYYMVGRYQDVIALASETVRVTPNLEESYYWRGLARQALGDVAGARSDYETALRYHEGWQPAIQALATLP